jgi:hypothetical protein
MIKNERNKNCEYHKKQKKRGGGAKLQENTELQPPIICSINPKASGLRRRRRHITNAISATVEQKPHRQTDRQASRPVGVGFP